MKQLGKLETFARLRNWKRLELAVALHTSYTTTDPRLSVHALTKAIKTRKMEATSASDASNEKKRTSVAAFHDAVDEDFHMKQLGENRSPEYTDLGVGSNILALSQMVRKGNPTTLVDLVLSTGTAQEIADLVVLQFVTRNTRGGKGEKALSFAMFLRFWRAYPETAKNLLPLFPHYGYWKDFLLLMSAAKKETGLPNQNDLIQASLEVMRKQLRRDISAIQKFKQQVAVTEQNSTADPEPDQVETPRQKGPKLSLLAKWLPREGSHFDKSIGFIEKFAPLMWPELSPSKKSDQTSNESWKSVAKAKYRKTVAELTSYYDLPEVLLSAKREEEINFEKVASKATFLLTKTFLNEDKRGNPRSENPKRIQLAEKFMDVVLFKGLKGGQVMPHEIVKKIMANGTISSAQELVLDAQWKDIWKGVTEQVKAKAAENGLEFNPTRMVPLSDVSGSMAGVPMEVAIALGIGLSEITHEAFRDMVMTFESQPQWHKLKPTDTIVQKVRSLRNAPWGGSTNFEAAYNLILDVAVRHNLPREDLPVLIVFSDMQFNEAAGAYEHGMNFGMETMHEIIKRTFKTVASKLKWTDDNPTPIVYWNLRNTGGHPVDKGTEGAVLLSGFSPSLLKLVMNGDALREEEVELVQADGTVKTEKIRVTPEEVLRKMLDDSLYDPVREVLVASREGKLVEYEIPLNGAAKTETGDDFELV